jgi:hypothetical protein
VSDSTDMAQIAQSVLSETASELQLGSDALPRQARDAFHDFVAAVGDLIQTGRQLQADYAELDAKRDLVPVDGWKRLRDQAIGEAQERSDGADRRARLAFDTLKAELQTAALPKVDEKREGLARQEFVDGLGDARGSAVRQRVVDLAQNGSREALAALLSPYGPHDGHGRIVTRG